MAAVCLCEYSPPAPPLTDIAFSIEQIVIFVTTPSVPNTSDLHIRPNGAGSAHINLLFKALFPKVFYQQLKQRSVHRSRMFLVAGFGSWKIPFIQSFFLSLAER